MASSPTVRVNSPLPACTLNRGKVIDIKDRCKIVIADGMVIITMLTTRYWLSGALVLAAGLFSASACSSGETGSTAIPATNPRSADTEAAGGMRRPSGSPLAEGTADLRLQAGRRDRYAFLLISGRIPTSKSIVYLWSSPLAEGQAETASWLSRTQR